MTVLDKVQGIVQPTVERIARVMVGVEHWPDCSFINLPLVYPDGSDVTVKVFPSVAGFRISDNEAAFRISMAHGVSGRAFVRRATQVANGSSVKRLRRSLFIDADERTLQAAISDVAQVSWRVAHQAVSADADPEEEQRDDDHLVDRLVGLFGNKAVYVRPTVLGASANPWRLTALVRIAQTPAAFQEVADTLYSVYRTSSAFSDISGLPSPPKLISVVRNKAALGPRLNLLSQTSHVIESAQADEVFRRVAA